MGFAGVYSREMLNENLPEYFFDCGTVFGRNKIRKFTESPVWSFGYGPDSVQQRRRLWQALWKRRRDGEKIDTGTKKERDREREKICVRSLKESEEERVLLLHILWTDYTRLSTLINGLGGDGGGGCIIYISFFFFVLFFIYYLLFFIEKKKNYYYLFYLFS